MTHPFLCSILCKVGQCERPFFVIYTGTELETHFRVWNMERIVRQTMLYDFYGELLTEHQRKAFEAVVMEDLSYAELARLENISRQGAYDMIRRCDKQLEEYENKLGLVEKFLRIREELRQMGEALEGLKGSLEPESRKLLERLQEQNQRIINDL